MADLLAAVSDLRASIGKIEVRLGSPDTKPVIEEIQAAINSLPGRLEEYPDMPSRRRMRFHPMMIDELRHMSEREGSREISILMAASMFRDLAPWVYEAGLEAYRVAKSGDPLRAREALQEFRRIAELTFRGPWGHEMFGRGSKEVFMLMEELPMMLRELESWDERPRRLPSMPRRKSDDSSESDT